MDGTKVKAFLFTLFIFLGAGYYFFGGGQLPDFSSLLEKFKKEPATTTKTTKRVDAKRGSVIDSYRGVKVYYNGRVSNVAGRNTTNDGYNLGLKYQCVEFAKRFYYETKRHKMPDSYGHAKDFFDRSLSDGQLNKARGMYQFRNGSATKPAKDDLVIIGGTAQNSFGHLFIITGFDADGVDFIQQNPGPRNPSRGKYRLNEINGKWYIDHEAILGWL